MKTLNAILSVLLVVAGFFMLSQHREINELQRNETENRKTWKKSVQTAKVSATLTTDLPRHMYFARPVLDADLQIGGYRYNAMALNTKKTSEQDVVNVCALSGYFNIEDIRNLPAEFKNEKFLENCKAVSELISNSQSTLFVYFKRTSGG